MAVKVLIPLPFRSSQTIKPRCGGSNVGELLESLEQSCPGIKSRLCDDQENPRFLNLYVNSEDGFSRHRYTLKEGDEVSIVPAVAGG